MAERGLSEMGLTKRGDTDGVGINKYGMGWRTDWMKIKEKLGRADKGNLFIAFPLLRSNKKDRGTIR